MTLRAVLKTSLADIKFSCPEQAKQGQYLLKFNINFRGELKDHWNSGHQLILIGCKAR
jgi:hypothetical protein